MNIGNTKRTQIMKNLTMDTLIRDTKDILKSRGIVIYIVQLILSVFSIKTTYQLYSTYPNKVSKTFFPGFLSTITQLIITAILTIFVILIINNAYEKIDFDYKQVLVNSFRKLPRYILGFVTMGGILLLTLVVYSVTMLLLGNTLLIRYIGVLVYIIALFYIMMRFSLMIYIMILESETSLINRCREFYKQDKNLIIKYFIVVITIGIIPIIFVTLPQWLGIELSKTAFLITRLIMNLIQLILVPISHILGLLIYKKYIN